MQMKNHKLTVRGKNKSIKLENIQSAMFGCGGQSNMEEPLQHIENGQRASICQLSRY